MVNMTSSAIVRHGLGLVSVIDVNAVVSGGFEPELKTKFTMNCTSFIS